MAKRVHFSNQELGLDEIAAHHNSLTAALRDYYSAASPSFAVRCGYYTAGEVEQELLLRLAEVDHASALGVMSATEAALRVDYLSRAYRKKKGSLSRTFRSVYKAKKEKASLEDIIVTWTDTGMMSMQLAGELKGAYKYRNWLAHGRYWTPKLDHKKYDFFTVYGIAEQVFYVIDQTL
jgi:hypothetical protein